ncbi:MAG TPA: ABC transporter permease subunit [Cytophagales bacterium]|nr:ABC transporter permease subunit [Cytophagales bacterium]
MASKLKWTLLKFAPIFYTIVGLSILAFLWQCVSWSTAPKLGKETETQQIPGPIATFDTLGSVVREDSLLVGKNIGFGQTFMMEVGLNVVPKESAAEKWIVNTFDSDQTYQDSALKSLTVKLIGSLGRVLAGFILGSLLAIPLGLVMGASKIGMSIVNPIVQVLRPVSPLAWFPLGMIALSSAGGATIFMIVITSLWPTLINTAFGVSNVPADHKNVAKAFGFSLWKYITKILIPYTLPHIFTGLKLSIGIAWMVIVAGEMLSGGNGLGFFAWESYNGGDLGRLLTAILVIGTVGIILDKLFTYLQEKVSYKG